LDTFYVAEMTLHEERSKGGKWELFGASDNSSAANKKKGIGGPDCSTG
jgi:hypothetical protein